MLGDIKGVLVLTIMIPTIPQRKKVFRELYMEVKRQVDFCNEIHPTLGDVEIIYDQSRRFIDGGVSIGKKRDNLVKRAGGKYVCFLDDDESIAPNYIETLLRLCNEDKDVCTFRNISKFDEYWAIVDLSINNENEQSRSDEMVLRKPWHICPVRSEYAKMHDFPDSNYGEDWEWFDKVLSHCTTEAKTNTVIHGYNHSIHKSEADKITNHA